MRTPVIENFRHMADILRRRGKAVENNSTTGEIKEYYEILGNCPNIKIVEYQGAAPFAVSIAYVFALMSAATESS